jgi:glutathione S-transferase
MSRKLYVHPLSGHSHRAALALSLLGLEYEEVRVDLANGAHKKPDFLAINPFGQVPVLEEDGTVISDSNAILVYLAGKYDDGTLLPRDPVAAAQIQRWFSVTAGELSRGPGAARLIKVFGRDFDKEKTLAEARSILTLLDQHLDGRDWLVGDHLTFADVAVYSYVKRAPEGDVDLSPYANVNA